MLKRVKKIISYPLSKQVYLWNLLLPISKTMKSNLLLIIALIGFSALSAQSNLPRQQSSALLMNARPDSMIRMFYNNGQWGSPAKHVYTYNDETNSVETVGYYLDTQTQTWNKDFKYIDLYNENNDLLSQMTMVVNGSSGLWDTSALNANYYDSFNRIEKWAYTGWNSEHHQWDSINKAIYRYLGGGDSLSYLIFSWNNTYSRWDSAYWSVMLFNREGKDSTGTYYSWNIDENKWDLRYNYVLYYDGDGNDTLYTQLVLNGGIWEPNYKSRASFNENGFRTSESVFYRTESGWKNTSRTEFEPDEDGNIKIVLSYEWSSGEQELIPVVRQEYYYPGEATANRNVQEFSANIYPNPAGSYLMIDMESPGPGAAISLYNLSGERVLHEPVASHTIIGLEFLQRGIYVYEITDGGKTLRGRISVM